MGGCCCKCYHKGLQRSSQETSRPNTQSSLKAERLLMGKSWRQSDYLSRMGFLIKGRIYQPINIVSIGFLISSNLVLSSAEIVSKHSGSTWQNFNFFLIDPQKIYSIDSINKCYCGYIRFNICLIRLSESVSHQHQFFTLGVNMTENIKLSRIKLKIVQDIPKMMKQAWIKYLQYKNYSQIGMITFDARGKKNDEGNPIILLQEPVVVGIQVNSYDSRRKSRNQAITFNDYILKDICSWMRGDEKKNVFVFQFDKKKLINIQQYVSSLHMVIIQSQLRIKEEKKRIKQQILRRKEQQKKRRQQKQMVLQRNTNKSTASPENQKVISNFHQKEPENIIKQSQMLKENNKNPRLSFEQRMGGYIDFSISGKYIEYVTVDGVRLYYELYNPQKTYTIDHLAQQYFQATNKQLNLSWKNVELAPKTPLKLVVSDEKQRQIFQKVMNTDRLSMIQQDQIKMKDYLEKLRKLHFNQLEDDEKFQIFIQIYKEDNLIERTKSRMEVKTTIRDLIQTISSNRLYSFSNYNIRSDNRRITSKEYQIPISKLHIKYIKIMLENKLCHISIKSNVFTECVIDNEVSIESLKELSNIRLLSFEQEKKCFTYHKLIKNRKSEKITNLCIIRYKSLNEIFELKCKQFTEVKVQGNIWKKICDLRLGQKLIGVNEELIDQCVFTLFERQYYYNTKTEDFCGLQIESTHNFIANRLIVHNHNHIQIQVKEFLQDIIKQYKIKVYDNQKIQQYFQEKEVYMAGVLLSKYLTFGDYQIAKYRHLIVTNSINHDIEQIKSQESNIEFTQWGNISTTINRYSNQQIQKWRNNYVGIYNNQILQIPKQNKAIKNCSDWIVVQKIYLERILFYDKISQYLNHNQLLRQYPNCKNGFIQHCQDRQLVVEEDKYPIYLYSTPCIHHRLNEVLRKQIIQSVKQQDINYFGFASILLESLSNISDLQDYITVYRGIPTSADVFDSIQEKLILFRGFTSTSKKKQIAIKFARKRSIYDKSVLFIINTITGKQVSKFSSLQVEEEVLINPYTYFFIEKQTFQGDLKCFYLTQVCLPCKNVNNLVFWVDDNPSYNSSIIQQIKSNIEIVQVVSTSLMKLIIQNFLWIYTLRGKKVTIITDMVREQFKCDNLKAGIDLLMILYKDYGLSNPGLVYTSRREPTIKLIEREGYQNILQNRYKVFTIQSQLIEQIENSFAEQRIINNQT